MYTIQITIPSINFFATETFTSADEMLARYSELVTEASDEIEIECLVK
jgi:hypothetical protein